MKIYFSILILILLLAGCDLFVTRDAEPPDQSRSNFRQAIEPEIVIENMVNAFTDKNVQNYLSCFVDSSFIQRKFVFSPSGEVLSQYPFLGTDWNLNDEQQYFNGIVSRISDELPVTLTFSDTSLSRIGDSVFYSASYFLNVPHAESEPTNYQGNLQFRMVNDSRAVWVIYYWQDNKSPDLPSWSELKGSFY